MHVSIPVFAPVQPDDADETRDAGVTVQSGPHPAEAWSSLEIT